VTRDDVVESPRVVACATAGAIAAVAAVVCQSALYLWNSFALDRPLYDIGNARTFNAWAGDVSLAACAALAALLAVAARRNRGTAMALTPLLVFFAIDEGTEIHDTIAEQVANALGIHRFGPDFVWPFLYAPLLLLAGALILRIGRSAIGLSRGSFRVGLAALVVAVVAQLVWGALENQVGYLSKGHILEIVVEEGGELGGWLMVGTGLAAAAVGARSWSGSPPRLVTGRLRAGSRPDPQPR
jgi:hypothetical protein